MAHKRRGLSYKDRLRIGQFCAICGSDYRICVDHIIPLALGGADDESNYQALCQPCNARKGWRRTNEEMKRWYAENKAEIDADRRDREYNRFNDCYTYRRPPADFKSARQRTEEGGRAHHS